MYSAECKKTSFLAASTGFTDKRGLPVFVLNMPLYTRPLHDTTCNANYHAYKNLGPTYMLKKSKYNTYICCWLFRVCFLTDGHVKVCRRSDQWPSVTVQGCTACQSPMQEIWNVDRIPKRGLANIVHTYIIILIDNKDHALSTIACTLVTILLQWFCMAK